MNPRTRKMDALVRPLGALSGRTTNFYGVVSVCLLASLMTLAARWGCTLGVETPRNRGNDDSVRGANREPIAATTISAPVAATTVFSVDASRKPDERSTYMDLPALSLFNVNTKQTVQLRLYDRSGHIDDAQVRLAEESMADARRKGAPVTRDIDRRLLQILVRAAYHYRGTDIEIVSGYRKPTRRREGYHALGRAVDFRILGVDAAELASYLRRIPKLGVGVYTHPKTQFVHLDVREQSFHWLDASPPRRRWKERSLGGRTLALLDKRYRRIDDWPEGLVPPVEERIPGTNEGVLK